MTENNSGMEYLDCVCLYGIRDNEPWILSTKTT